MVCHFLLQGIFLTQGSNPRSPALQADALAVLSPLHFHVNFRVNLSISVKKIVGILVRIVLNFVEQFGDIKSSNP